MSPEGVLENISVFERLSLAAQQKIKNEEKARELASKGQSSSSSFPIYCP